MNKLNCKDVCLLLSLYIDDMLSDEEMTQVREHLEECDSCRNEYILLKGIMDNSAHLECPALSDTFKTGLHDKLLQESQLMEKPNEEEKTVVAVPSVRKWRIYPYIAAGAAAIVISVLALSNLPDSDSFISDIKTDTVESAMPMQTQTAESEGSIEPALESSSPEPYSSNNETSEPTEANKAMNADEQNLEVDNAMTLSADEEKSDIEDELKVSAEESMRSMPKMASFEEEVVNEAALEEDTDIAENATEITAASGGGSSAAAIDEKVRVSVIFSFNHDSIEQVREAMSGVSSRGSVYEVPISSLSEYISRLESIDGYISHRQLKEDYTAEYGLLEKNGDRFGRMAQINEYTQKATIIIGS